MPNSTVSTMTGLLQGLAIMFFAVAVERDIGWAKNALFYIPYVSMVVILPVLFLLLRPLRENGRFRPFVAGGAVVLLVMGLSFGWNFADGGARWAGGDFFVYGLTVALLAYISLPFLQSFQACGNPFDYGNLYLFAWKNTLTLITAGLFTGITWALLGLWHALFKLIGIKFFGEMFTSIYFAYTATGVMAGYGIYLGQTRTRVDVVARIDYLTRVLTLLLAFVAVLFIVALPFTGLEALWETNNATFILLCFVAALVLFVNGLYQQGYAERSETPLVRNSIHAALLSLPVLTAIAAYATFLRIDQYGLSVQRVWAVVAVAVAAIYAIGYARSVFARGEWLRPVAKTNIIAACCMIAFLVLLRLPMLNPYSLAAGSQVDRLLSGSAQAGSFDFAYLRFELGRTGMDALQELAAAEGVDGAEEIRRQAAAMLERNYRYEWQAEKRKAGSPDQFLAMLHRYPDGATFDKDFTKYLFVQRLKWPINGCLRQAASCVLIRQELNRQLEGAEYILITANEDQVFGKVDGRWQQVGHLNSDYLYDGTEAVKALDKKAVEIVPPRWQAIRIGERVLQVIPE